MNIVVREDLKAYIDPLTPDEYAALEQSLLAEGCRDALVLWGDVLVDGHNRYGICQKHGLPFNTVQNTRFTSMEDVHLWMIDQHLGRRSVSDFQRGVLALRRRDILLERSRQAAPAPAPAAPEPAGEGDAGAPPWDTSAPAAAAPVVTSAMLPTREELARAAKLSNSQVAAIEKIQKQATPEVIAAVRAGELSINAAAVVATLPAQEQQAAAQGGAQELKEAAKRVRDAKKRPKPAAKPVENLELPQLRTRLAQLQEEIAAVEARIAELEAAA
ncbi:plasmid replication/partition related protein [Pseudoxanthomonas winnipegensis]|uniref:Plasmid replication/partition related protein n=1 Tax=Pseudoxanthomonas winnipegensis TaxID=2480810 RepID=A0A4Q8LP56_9GAMM|nr:plasmid replication/partition related protein [Pseudoxanthomonas winnipegensis]RZZ89555.1 plasmid replication/partition related protein [Pseudoxanthomonas winnipegensis]TAA33004.1 plasmid replication/partition related protein [Pseudoxanthomonas winnipegensis]TAA43252.1 plasmid replication/partition related protein [Pseudoxanthomonas winnipegensis]TBV78514.1 plasmid replication/partition related protein [Pseudoxanthomonas winnipegensis]